MQSNEHMFNGGAQKPSDENEYHKRIREFSKGNVGTENMAGNYKMMRFRLPLYVYRVLRDMAESRSVPVGRFIIEILRSVADKEVKRREQDPMLGAS